MIISRIKREQECVEKMIKIYCLAKHGKATGLCEECQELLDYAAIRLQHCKFDEDKPVCADCPIHCYHPLMRGRIIEVMRVAGPRMMFKHPILTVLHFLDACRNPGRQR